MVMETQDVLRANIQKQLLRLKTAPEAVDSQQFIQENFLEAISPLAQFTGKVLF